MTDEIEAAIAKNPELRDRIDAVHATARRIAKAREAELPRAIGTAGAVAVAAPPPSSSLGPALERIVSRHTARWAAKDATAQTSQRIDELTALAVPVFKALMSGAKPPTVRDGAVAAVQDVALRGWASDLGDAVLASAVRQRLEAHWSAVLGQRARAARTASRTGNRERDPGRSSDG